MTLHIKKKQIARLIVLFTISNTLHLFWMTPSMLSMLCSTEQLKEFFPGISRKLNLASLDVKNLAQMAIILFKGCVIFLVYSQIYDRITDWVRPRFNGSRVFNLHTLSGSGGMLAGAGPRGEQ